MLLVHPMLASTHRLSVAYDSWTLLDTLGKAWQIDDS